MKYLTKEDIENEGWVITLEESKPSPYKVNWINAEKGVHDLWINLALTNSMFMGINANDAIVYRGKCETVEDFKILNRLLNIK